MAGNQVVSTMFDFKTSFHMARIVSFRDWNEDAKWLGNHLLNCLSSSCDGRLFEVMTWIHIVCLVVVSSIEFR